MKALSYIMTFFLLVLVMGGGSLYYMRDKVPPKISWNNSVEVMGKKGELEIVIKDLDRGIGNISIMLQSAGGKTVALYNESFTPPVKEKTITIPIEPRKLQIKEGEVKLLVEAVDKPAIEFLSPNQETFSASFTVDMTPPRLVAVTGLMYLWRGGSQMVVYRVSEETSSSGIRFGDREYPGFTGIYPDRPRTGLVFFPFPVTKRPKGYPILFARDRVGNEAVVDINIRLKNKTFRSSDLNISDGFLDRKMPILAQMNEIPGETNLDIYIYANRTLREQNAKKIAQICQNSVAKMLWEGSFHQLTNSKVESRFADHRNYYYKKEKIDEQDHLGVDLAVTRQYPVGAAANGVVAFEGALGIYGNTVILDHGLGVSTLYGHLSDITVKTGQELGEKEMLGKTGETGLAGGDHLHFAVLLHGVPVNPLEWWDRNWIRMTVTDKLRGIIPQEEATEESLIPEE